MRIIERRIPTKNLWIFCEGEKTEKNYFNKLKIDKRVSRLNIKVISPKNSDAVGIVKYAVNHVDSKGFQEGDIIYCVFDRDNNSDQKLQQAENFAKTNKIKIIFSNPCFEYWILSHFEYYANSCEYPELESKIERHLKPYKKNDSELYSKTKDKLPEAIKNSKRIFKKHKENGISQISRNSNPSTGVFEIIEKVIEMKENPC
ncbi:MAG: RloB domain-containing protein [Candidatus Aenigmarchaeota archaeon]|nr:RloB domain-containing protein [Candidatus Aenigmarchaeota archaeon]